MAAIDEESVPIAARPAVPVEVPVPAQADSDTALIRLWLAGKAPPTSRAYAADVTAFLRYDGKPLCALTLARPNIRVTGGKVAGAPDATVFRGSPPESKAA